MQADIYSQLHIIYPNAKKATCFNGKPIAILRQNTQNGKQK